MCSAVRTNQTKTLEERKKQEQNIKARQFAMYMAKRNDVVELKKQKRFDLERKQEFMQESQARN